MDCFTYNEKINVNNAKYLLSIPDDDLKMLIDPSGAMNCEEEGESIYNNINVYAKQVKKWLKHAIHEMEKKGFIKQKYKYANSMPECGRRYVVGFGVQKMKKSIRGFLCHGECHDLDMVNAHPSILLYVVKTYFPEIKHNLLQQYVEHRADVLKKADTTKTKVISAMNHSQKHRTNNQLFCKLDDELKTIQKMIFNKMDTLYQFPSIINFKKNQLKQNKEGKYIATILTYFENKIISLVESNLGDKIHTIVYDGFHLDINEDIDENINLMNNMTQEFGVKWDLKKFDNSIIIDEAVDIDYDGTMDYEDCKEEFEKNHFIIQNPFVFAKLYTIGDEHKYQFYSKEKFKDLVKPIKYFDADYGFDKEFFPTWLEDANRKCYKEVKFIPSYDENTEIFNSFKGFNFKQNYDFKFDKTDKKHINVLTTFTKHLLLLTNKDEKSANYLFNYLAHLIQKPTEKPKVSIVIKGKEGLGKDTLMTMLNKLLGDTYGHNTANLDDIFGSYNAQTRDKLFMTLNEVEGKGGYENVSKIKDYITADTTTIREKYVGNMEQVNYIRLFIFSNNLNPVAISSSDRRMVVFKTHHIIPKPDYFVKLHAMINNKISMEILFNILASRDISNFNAPADRPITDAYNNMKEHNINPIYGFLYDCFISGNYKDYFDTESCKRKKNSNTFYVKPDDLFQAYKCELSKTTMEYMKPNYKVVKSILADIGINKKCVRIGKTPLNHYVIDKDELEEQLKDMMVDEEIEEFDEDDFE
jgi:hypothetical protein